jgi:hypothetical protein
MHYPTPEQVRAKYQRQKISNLRWRRKNRAELIAKKKKWYEENRERAWAYATIAHKIRLGFDVKFLTEDLTRLALKHEPCRYCGEALDYGCQGKLSPKSPSLDRIENVEADAFVPVELGIKDVQIICHKCNRTKSDRTHKEFIEYCEMVVNRSKLRTCSR